MDLACSEFARDGLFLTVSHEMEQLQTDVARCDPVTENGTNCNLTDFLQEQSGTTVGDASAGKAPCVVSGGWRA